MLLRHPWLAELAQPSTISEEDEEAESFRSPVESEMRGDQEVSDWVIGAIAKRKARTEAWGRAPESERPPLHAAPLDAVMAPPVGTTSRPKAKPPGSVEEATDGIESMTVDE
jgi:mitogen-activated protein kinase kinase